MTEIEELKVRTQIAGAELSLVERVRWGIAVLSALYLEVSIFNSWTIPVAVGIVLLFVLPYWHRKRYDQAWDAYEKATGTGKFAEQTPEA
ncbi:MAG: hypothetical protein H6943_03800 [Zoogloeaceae bacterium]|nr:hypothetical protein [Zoogloeaceae bacterium]